MSSDEGEPHFLDAPEVKASFEILLEEFSRETDRGAVLVAAEVVSEHLKKLISASAPSSFSAKQMKEMLTYPGMLSSFAARSDLAHMAGFLDETSYRSATRLRKLRNLAAHSHGTFSLREHYQELREICDLGPNVSSALNRFAVETLMHAVLDRLLKTGSDLETRLGRNPFPDPKAVIDYLHENPEVTKPINARVPKMELALGVWILIGLIGHARKAKVTN